MKESITNRGANNALPSTVRYYLSANFGFDAADIPLAETRSVDLLLPNASSAGETVVRIPAGTAPATYYLIVQADGNGVVAESSETNNTIARQIRVQ